MKTLDCASVAHSATARVSRRAFVVGTAAAGGGLALGLSIDPAAAAKDLAERSGAAGIVLSGARTGSPVDARLLDTVRAAVGSFPVWLGSGLDPDGVAFGSYVNMGCHTDLEAARSLVRGGLTTFARFSVMHGKANGPVSSGDRAVLEALRSNYDMKAHTRGDSRQAGTLTDDFIDRFAIVGRPERCIERLKSLAALGLDKVAVSGASRGAAESDIAVGRRLVTMEVLPGLKAA